MTMPGSGPISLGMARDECRQGNPINAGNPSISQLAGVSSGARFAWSWWYNKSFLPTYNQALFSQMSAHVDRFCFFTINLRTGEESFTHTSGADKEWLLYYQPYMDPLTLINEYTTISVGLQRVSGRANLDIIQQPVAGNDWTCVVQLNDDPFGGQSDTTCNLLITAIP